MIVIIVAISSAFSIRNEGWDTSKRILFPVFCLYLYMVTGITLLFRWPYDCLKFSLTPFWSYRRAVQNRNLLLQILLNYVMLLPFGIMAPVWMKRRYVLIVGTIFSVAIELIQFCMRRGRFEFDDIIGNTIGVLIGLEIYTLIRKDGQ